MKIIGIVIGVIVLCLLIKTRYNFNKSMELAYDLIDTIDNLSIKLVKDIYIFELHSEINGREIVTKDFIGFYDILEQYGVINYITNPGKIWRKIVLNFIDKHNSDIINLSKGLQ